MTMTTAEAVIAGIGEVPVRRDRSRTLMDIAIAVAEQAIEDSGLERSDIDAILMAPCFADRWFNADLGFGRLADELGLRDSIRISAQVNAGGSTADALLKTASGLVTSGQARAVLCLHAEKFTSLTSQEGFDFFAIAGTESEFEAPYGMNYNAIPALAARRFMYETDTTLEQIGAVAVSCREWAELNPNALFRKHITLADVMASPDVATPLKSLMLNALGDGGSAFIVTDADTARSVTSTPVYVWGHGEASNRYSFSHNRDITTMGWDVAGARAFEDARITVEDVDVVELYTAYPIFKLIALEQMGFFPRGKSGEFAEQGVFGPGGALPMCTNGGTLSYGHTGAGVGVAFLVESCRQLMGKAGERQVEDVDIVLKTGCGGAYYDSHVTILGKEPR